MKPKWCFALLTALVLVSSIRAAAYLQFRTSGESERHVKGMIVDWQDARVVNASILFEGKNFRRELASDEAGEFTVTLPIGTYRVRVSHPVFKPYVIKNFKVSASETPILKIRLNVKTPLASGGKCPKGHLCL